MVEILNLLQDIKKEATMGLWASLQCPQIQCQPLVQLGQYLVEFLVHQINEPTSDLQLKCGKKIPKPD